MDNPEYTQQRLNEVLSGSGLSVVWDGDEPACGEAASFNVCSHDDDTDLLVWDHGSHFEIVESEGSRSYVSLDEAKTFEGLAEKLTDIFGLLGEAA